MMSSKTREYQKMVDDVIAGGLLDEDEIVELRDMLARVERKMAADMPASVEIAQIILGESHHG